MAKKNIAATGVPSRNTKKIVDNQKSDLAEQLAIGPSLPPFVEGQLRCFLHVSLGEMKWTAVKPPKDVRIGIKWWGQQSDSVILQPQNNLKSYMDGNRCTTEIKYPIRSGPKQFTSYLKDMGMLVLDVISIGEKIGQIDIKDIGQLCPSRPLQRFYPIKGLMAKGSTKEIGVLFVSLEFQSVAGSFHMTSSTIPTTDMPNHSKPTAGMQNSDVKPRNPSRKIRKEVKISSSSPEKYEYSEVDLENTATNNDIGSDGNVAGKPETKEQLIGMEQKGFSTITENTIKQSGTKPELESNSIQGKTGNSSWIENSPSGDKLDEHSVKPMVNLEDKSNKESNIEKKFQGNLFKTILERFDDDIDDDDADAADDDDDDDDDKNNEKSMSIISLVNDDNTFTEKDLVDLVTGEDNLFLKHDMDQSRSDDVSDMEDPIHDESLITDLFYARNSDVSDLSSVIITDDSDDDGNGSRDKSRLEDAGNKRLARHFRDKGGRKRIDEIHEKKKSSSKSIPKLEHAGESSPEDVNSMTYLDVNSNSSAKCLTPLKEGNESLVKQLDKLIPEGMDLDSITHLARVQFARVFVHNFHPHANLADKYKHCTFFIEYEFPVNVKDADGNSTCGSEVIRCVSSKHFENRAQFNHRSIFPVHFNAETLVKWWNKGAIFKVFVRSPNKQTPEELGSASFALRPVLLADGFIIQENIEAQPKRRDTSDKTSPVSCGTLQITVALGTEKSSQKRRKDHSKSKEESSQKNDEIKITNYYPQQKSTNSQPIVDKIDHIASITRDHRTKEKGVTDVGVTDKPSSVNIALYSLLQIQHGRGISIERKGSMKTPCNAYLLCRLLWHSEVAKTDVCWNDFNPKFDLHQMTPIMMNDELLQKMKNNFMVIEVWHKASLGENDKLIGIVKISLHQFHLYFKQSNISSTVLKSQYPVLAVDGMVAVEDLFTSESHGEIKVTLAFGTHNQIQNLIRMKDQQEARTKKNTKNHQHQMQTDSVDKTVAATAEHPSTRDRNSVEHIIVVSIDAAKGINMDDSTGSGERDCYVQYQFPFQSKKQTVSALKWYETPTILSTCNPVFCHSIKHSFVLPSGSPLQSYLLSALESKAGPKAAGITFEIWQRSYYPNIRDNILFKAIIPIAKLCAMIAMNKPKEISHQSFQLPLTPSGNMTSHGEISYLDVNISYQKTQIQNHELELNRSPCVCLSVSVLRACGLKACTWNTKRAKNSQITSYDGFNTFVRVAPSFLDSSCARTSQVIARSFAPTFSYHVDFPVCIFDENMEEDERDHASSLAYQLESGHLEVELFHQPSKGSFVPVRSKADDEDEDVLLGTCKVPLIGLLSRQTAIKGWFSLHRAEGFKNSRSYKKDLNDSDEMGKMAGGIELIIKFANQSDRELVINMARGVGWSPIESFDADEDLQNDSANHGLSITAGLVVEKLWISKPVLEKLSGVKNEGDALVYCRYKFYDKTAISSRAVGFVHLSSDTICAELKHKKDFLMTLTSPFSWYLREELFEVQFWLKPEKFEEINSTLQRDRLIGSAYMDLSVLAKRSSFKGVVSGLYPMFKFGSDFLGKSCARISLRFQDSNNPNIEDSEESFTSEYLGYEDRSKTTDSILTEDVTSNKADQLKIRSELPVPVIKDSDDTSLTENEDDCVGAGLRILIDEALHLHVAEHIHQERNSSKLYVSYQLTPFASPVYTQLAENHNKPKWLFERKERIDPNKIPNQIISFKVFCKSNEEGERIDTSRDVLIGTAAVDITSLHSGFRQIYGWYNIRNFAGQCSGQIKIGVIPEMPLATSPSARYFRNEVLADKVYGSYNDRHPVIPFDLDIEVHDTGNPAQQIKCNDFDASHKQDVHDLEPSKSILFNKLRDQMEDLDSLTSSLRSRLHSNMDQLSTNTNDALIVSNDAMWIDKIPEHPKLSLEHEDQDDNNRRSNSCNDTNVPSNAASCDISLEEDCRKEIGSYAEHHLPDRNALNMATETLASDIGSDISFDNIVSTQTDRELDSFDDVLESWKTYREEFKVSDLHLDADSQKSNSWLSDVSYKLENQIDIKSDRMDIEHEMVGNDFRQVKNSGSSSSDEVKYFDEDVRTEDLQGANYEVKSSTSDEDVGERTINLNKDIFIEKSSEMEDESEKDDCNIAETVENDAVVHPEKEKEIFVHPERLLEKDVNHITHAAAVGKIPNFFMPPEKLAESMRKLRLAAMIPHHNQEMDQANDIHSSESRETRLTNQETGKQYERRKMFYGTENTRLSLNKPPPVQTSEINRIASIFSSKYK